MIAKARLPATVVERINRHADAQVTPGTGRELILPAPLIYQGGADCLAEHTSRLLRGYLAGAEGAVAGKIDFEVFWVISQYAGTPSSVHFHCSDLAGVL